MTGWQGFIKVDGKNYNWMGAHPGATLVEQTGFEYTSTRSIFTVNAGGLVEMVIEFLSPVSPDDLRRQSITSSYLQVSVRSLDGRGHRVQLYADVSGGMCAPVYYFCDLIVIRCTEWASGDRGAVIEWEYSLGQGLQYHKFWRREQDIFNETADQASWGNWHWATGVYVTRSHSDSMGKNAS